MEGGEAAGAKKAASLCSRIYALLFRRQHSALCGTRLLAVGRARADGGSPAMVIVPVVDATPATTTAAAVGRKITVKSPTLGGENRWEAPSTATSAIAATNATTAAAGNINERSSEFIRRRKEALRMGSGAARPSSHSAPSIKYHG